MKRKDAGKSKKTESVRKTRRIGENSKREEIFQKAGAYSAVFFMAFFVALVSASAFTPVDKTNADTSEVSLGYSNEGYSISLASFGNNESDVLDPKVGMTLTGTPAGEIAVEYDRLKVTTNSTTYKLYLGMSDTSQKLLNTSETGSGEYCENAASTASCYFSATANTPSGANALDVNTWGFAIPTKYGFDGEYITSGGKKSNGAEAITDAGPGEYVSSNSKFAAVPTVANSVMIATGNQKAEQGKNYYIYYGVKADTGKVSGTYEGTVVYTALAEASDSADGKITSVVPDAQKTLDNSSLPVSEQRITITTTLYGSEEMISKVQDENDVIVTIGGKTCTDPQLSVPGNTGTGPIQVSCAQPTMNRWGSYDVAVTIGNYGQYNLRAGYSYYVPWADMEAHPGEYSMQQFTTKACSEVATPEAYTGSITDGNYRAVANVPEVSLKDSRNENHVYRVRKLADGNCWMADNLRLTLDDNVALTSVDSDINYNMDTGEGWDGTTTPVRTISNPLKVNGPVLGTYSTNSSTGVISWTPFADTQKGTGTGSDNPTRYGYNISWMSPYKDKNGTPADSGTDVAATYRHFGMDGKTPVTETKTYKVNNNQWSEYARSYSNAASGQTGVGDGSGSEGKIQMNDGDGQPQYYGNYYNMYAASAGSVTYAMASGDGMNSICPANWELPRNDGDRSWYNLLYTKYGMTVTGNGSSEPEKAAAIAIENTAVKKAPFSIILGGDYNSTYGILNYRGAGAYYWYGSLLNRTYVNILRVYVVSHFFPQTQSNKTDGFSIRCVAR